MFVRVIDSEHHDGESVIEMPIEQDGCMLLSTLRAHYPNASGLKYCSKESGAWRAVRVADDKLYPSENNWNDVETYHIAYPKGLACSSTSSATFKIVPDCGVSADSKRKVEDDGVGDSDSKLRRVDGTTNSEKPKCTDLIVLGISFKSSEDDLHGYFEQFGPIELCEIKRDVMGNSKGFGFVRFRDYNDQLKVLRQNQHPISGRSCQVKIPESKFVGGATMRGSYTTTRKVFVARLPQGTTCDDLRQYFSKYGDIVDVYMSQPFRSFAFVTFRNPECVPLLFTQSHTINGTAIHIGPAEPKGSNDRNMSKSSGHGTMRQYWSNTSGMSSPNHFTREEMLLSMDSPFSSRDTRHSSRGNDGGNSRYSREDYLFERGSVGGYMMDQRNRRPVYDDEFASPPASYNNRRIRREGNIPMFDDRHSVGGYNRHTPPMSDYSRFQQQQPRGAGYRRHYQSMSPPASSSATTQFRPCDSVPSHGANIDMSSMASMLTPAMMATFLNFAAAAATQSQPQQQSNSSGDVVRDSNENRSNEAATPKSNSNHPSDCCDVSAWRSRLAATVQQASSIFEDSSAQKSLPASLKFNRRDDGGRLYEHSPDKHMRPDRDYSPEPSSSRPNESNNVNY